MVQSGDAAYGVVDPVEARVLGLLAAAHQHIGPPGAHFCPLSRGALSFARNDSGVPALGHRYRQRFVELSQGRFLARPLHPCHR